MNYGVSGNTSIDGYYDLRFLIEHKVVLPTHVFVMYVINDLRAFLMGGGDNFIIAGWNQPPVNLASHRDNPDYAILFGLHVQDSSLLSFIKFNIKNIFGHKYYDSYLAVRKAQAHLQQVTQDEFISFLDKLYIDFLPKRADVYSEIDTLARSYNINLVFLTQPHSYREDFMPLNDDLRLYPVLYSKKMTPKQAAMVMNILNNQNRELAHLFNRHLIDVEACFLALDPSSLFYDSVHYTLKGSVQFAECVNSYLEKIVQNQ